MLPMYLRAMGSCVLLMVCVAAQGQQKPPKPVRDARFNQEQWNEAVGLGGGSWGIFAARRTGRRTSPHRANIDAGIAWLKQQQHEDGRWVVEEAPDLTVALTSLAMLTMLGDGSTMRSGAHRKSIKEAAKWLRANQAPDGAFASATGPHMLATLAMVEAYYLSSYTLLRRSSQRGLAWLDGRRLPDGGFSATTGAEHSDPALPLWGATLFVVAIDAGLMKREGAYDGLIKWMKDPRALAVPDAGVVGVPVSPERLAEVEFDQAAANAFTRYWLGIADHEAHKESQQAALEHARLWPREWAPGVGRKLSIHEWFCSAYALQQAGEEAAAKAIADRLAARQVTEGDERGSWEPIGVYDQAGGRVWTTAMAVLVLEVPFRYGKHLPR